MGISDTYISSDAELRTLIDHEFLMNPDLSLCRGRRAGSLNHTTRLLYSLDSYAPRFKITRYFI
jgi:hypothetical protein